MEKVSMDPGLGGVRQGYFQGLGRCELSLFFSALSPQAEWNHSGEVPLDKTTSYFNKRRKE